jgi:ribonuclease HI
MGSLAALGEHEKVLTGSEQNTTNNRMELTAALRGLEALKRPSRVDLYTDSEYLRRGITEWLPGWRRRGWRRKGGELKNVDLWQALDKALQTHQVSWHWVRGHAGHRENERVDRLAKTAIRGSSGGRRHFPHSNPPTCLLESLEKLC